MVFFTSSDNLIPLKTMFREIFASGYSDNQKMKMMSHVKLILWKKIRNIFFS